MPDQLALIRARLYNEKPAVNKASGQCQPLLLECAIFMINDTVGPNQPIKLGKLMRLTY